MGISTAPSTNCSPGPTPDPSRSRPWPENTAYSEGEVNGACLRWSQATQSSAPKCTESLRVCPRTLCGITEPSQHDADGGEFEEGERFAVEALPVLDEPATAVEPGKRALDDPPLR